MKVNKIFTALFFVAILATTSFPQGFTSKDATTHVDAGNKLYDKGEYAKAIEEYNEALYLSPNLTEAIYYRGQAFFELGKFKDALSDFNRAIDLSPNYTDVYKWRAKTFQELAGYQDAVKDWNRVIDATGGTYDEFYARGKSLLVLEFNEEAIADLLQAIHGMPTNSNLHLYLGIAYSNLKKYKTALEYYGMALDFDMSNHRVFFFRGKANYNYGRYANAVNDLTDFIESGENISAETYNLRGLAYLGLNEPLNGIPDLTKAVQMYPTSAEYLSDLGYGYELDKSYDEAIKWYTKALKYDNSYVDAYIGRGRSKIYLGDTEGACGDWGLALDHGYVDNDGMIRANCK